MEEHAHPFATHAARGYMLKYFTNEHSHQLQAIIPGKNFRDDPDAHLTWESQKPRGGERDHAPGEVEMIENMARGTKQGSGLGPALFHSAHHFDFGQTTVPIHSPIRTQAGQHFAATTRPELRPDIWFNASARMGQGQFENLEGERTNKINPEWNLPSDFHPYQQKKIASERELAQKMRAKNRKPRGQGSLF